MSTPTVFTDFLSPKFAGLCEMTLISTDLIGLALFSDRTNPRTIGGSRFQWLGVVLALGRVFQGK